MMQATDMLLTATGARQRFATGFALFSRRAPALARILLLLALATPWCVHAADANGVCRVKLTGGSATSGATWSDALNFQAALADPGCAEIWVAAGVYMPSTAADPAMSFQVRPGVAVYGGFAGTETVREARLPGLNLTVLSGDIDGNDDDANGDGIIEDSNDIHGSNSYHVLLMDGTTSAGNINSDTVLDGFVITAGRASVSGYPGNAAGGLICDGSGQGNACSPRLANLVFSGNRAHQCGALINRAWEQGTANPTLVNVSFIGNHAAYNGGALCNKTYHGVVSPSFTNVTFSHNDAGLRGGAINNSANQGTVSPVLSHVSFIGNHSGQYGGAIYNDISFGTIEPVVHSAILWANSAIEGAEIYNEPGAAPIIDHSIIGGSGGSGTGWDDDLGTDGGGNLDVDPLLGALADNGGFGQTFLPDAGSPAIDAAAAVDCPASDQRGVSRPRGVACDIGAVEARQVQVTVTVSGAGSVTEHTTPGPESGGIITCTDAGLACAARYFGEGTLAASFDLAAYTGHHIASASGCGGSLSGSLFTTAPLASDCALTVSFATSSHVLGGTVAGLAGSGLTLHLSHGAAGSEDLAVDADGAFAFATPVAYAAAYAVSVATQPVNPQQTCVLAHASGNMPDHDVSNVLVSCSTAAFQVAGAVSGLTASGFTLQLNGGTPLALPASASSYSFAAALADGASYSVTVASQPDGQVCALSNPTGSIQGADAQVDVTCSDAQAALVMYLEDGTRYLRYGALNNFLVRLDNTGSATAEVVISSSELQGYDESAQSWQCFDAPAGVSCGTPSGSGAFATTASIEPGKTLALLLSVATPVDSAAAIATVKVDVAGANHPSVVDDDVLVIMRDGFDPSGVARGAAGAPPWLAAGSRCRPVNKASIVAVSVPTRPGVQPIDTLWRAHGADGSGLALQRANVGSLPWLRLVATAAGSQTRASRWVRSRAGAPLALGLAGTEGQAWLLLEGASEALQLPLHLPATGVPGYTGDACRQGRMP